MTTQQAVRFSLPTTMTQSLPTWDGRNQDLTITCYASESAIKKLLKLCVK